jgi:hypothetical protein
LYVTHFCDDPVLVQHVSMRLGSCPKCALTCCEEYSPPELLHESSTAVCARANGAAKIIAVTGIAKAATGMALKTGRFMFLHRSVWLASLAAQHLADQTAECVFAIDSIVDVMVSGE